MLSNSFILIIKMGMTDKDHGKGDSGSALTGHAPTSAHDVSFPSDKCSELCAIRALSAETSNGAFYGGRIW
jgi:hypothetical protein